MNILEATIEIPVSKPIIEISLTGGEIAGMTVMFILAYCIIKAVQWGVGK